MRSNLKNYLNQRRTFVGEFERVGSKICKNQNGLTILLLNVRDSKTGVQVSDHNWLNLTKGFKSLGFFKKGDKIVFDARVIEYKKGYKNNKKDFKFSYPSKVRKIC